MKIPFLYFRREATPGGDKGAWEIGIRFSFPWRDRKKAKPKPGGDDVRKWEEGEF